MAEKIGVFGSADGVSPLIHTTTRRLGEVLATYQPTLITGACPGVPYMVAAAAYGAGLRDIWGFSPARDYKEHAATYPNEDHTIYSRLVFVPKDNSVLDDPTVARKYRNVFSTAACDGGLVVAGRYGSLNEFTNLYDMGKVIGVLTGTGGVADLLPQLHQAINKPSNASVHFSSSPEELVQMVVEEIRRRH